MDLSRLVRCAPLALAAFFAGCGYVAGPQLPLANVPQPIGDLAAIQRGATIIVHCTLPLRTTENNLIKTPLKLDFRVATPGDDWAERAKAMQPTELKDGRATYEIPVKDWVGKEIVMGVRTITPKGKESPWSNYQTLSVVSPPEVPSAPVLTKSPIGFLVTWTGKGDQFRVMRRGPNDENFIIAMTSTAHEWTDNGVENGKSYEYKMQALVNTGNNKVAESDFSATTADTYKDIFPPAVPAGLHADPSGNAVSLVWDPDSEPDLAGYRIYRSEGDGPWKKIADSNAIPSYSDSTVEKGKTYHYAVSAFDKLNNESEHSPPVTIVP